MCSSGACACVCVFDAANLDVRAVQEEAGDPRQNRAVVPRQHGQAGHTRHGPRQRRVVHQDRQQLRLRQTLLVGSRPDTAAIGDRPVWRSAAAGARLADGRRDARRLRSFEVAAARRRDDGQRIWC